MMCEHVAEPCGCGIAVPRRRSLGRDAVAPRRGERAVPDAIFRLPRLRELDLSRNELLRGAPTTSRRSKLETLGVTETALEALPARLLLPRLRRVAADEASRAPAGPR